MPAWVTNGVLLHFPDLKPGFLGIYFLALHWSCLTISRFLRSGFGRFIFVFISGVEVECQTGSEPGGLCWQVTHRFAALFLSDHRNTANPACLSSFLLTAFLCGGRCIMGNSYLWVSCGLVANDDLMREIFHGLMGCLVQICPENRSAALQSLNDCLMRAEQILNVGSRADANRPNQSLKHLEK